MADPKFHYKTQSNLHIIEVLITGEPVGSKLNQNRANEGKMLNMEQVENITIVLGKD